MYPGQQPYGQQPYGYPQGQYPMQQPMMQQPMQGEWVNQFMTTSLACILPPPVPLYTLSAHRLVTRAVSYSHTSRRLPRAAAAVPHAAAISNAAAVPRHGSANDVSGQANSAQFTFHAVLFSCNQ